MTNRVYDLKIAEPHLSLIAEALGTMPYNRVYQILASINIQVQRQLQAANDEPELPIAEAAE